MFKIRIKSKHSTEITKADKLYIKANELLKDGKQLEARVLIAKADLIRSKSS